MEITEFELEMINEWRKLRPSEKMVITKHAENALTWGTLEPLTKKIIHKNLTKSSSPLIIWTEETTELLG